MSPAASAQADRDSAPSPPGERARRVAAANTDATRAHLTWLFGGRLRKRKVEVRSLGNPPLSRTSRTSADLVETVGEWVREGRNCYACVGVVGLDYTDEPGSAVKNENVTRRLVMLVDIDSTRADHDAPATDYEAQAAIDAALGIRQTLQDVFGFPAAAAISTGNGCQIQYRCDLINDASTAVVAREFLAALDRLFPAGRGWKVDKSVHNSARLMRLAGTINVKPRASVERPNRAATILDAPEDAGLVTADMLRVVVQAAALIDDPGPDRPREGNRLEASSSDSREAPDDAYVRMAIAGECAEIEATESGGRHDRVRTAALKLGRYLGQSGVGRKEMGRALAVSASRVGLPEREAAAVIEWGLEAGRAKPRTIPEPKAKRVSEGPKGEPSRGGRNGQQNDVLQYAQLSDEDLGLTPGHAVRPAPIRWSWKYRKALGELTMICGDGGGGKTTLALFMAAAATRGLPWPEPGAGNAPLGRAIILSAEDDPRSTLAPRLAAMGADPDRFDYLTARVRIKREGKPPQVHPLSFQDLDYWREVFDRRPDCVEFFVDPLPGYLGRGINDSRNNEVRSVLEPFLSEIIRPRMISMTCSTHLNKSVDASTPVHRVLGSVAYVNLSRNVHLVVADPGDPDRRIFKQAKSNLAPAKLPALAFRMEVRHVEGEGGELIEAVVPVFEDAPVEFDVGKAMKGESKRGPEPTSRVTAARWLVDHLRDKGYVRLSSIFDSAGEAGFVGKRKQDGKWSNLTGLYRAKDYVPELGEDYAGLTVEDMKETNDRGLDVTFWRLLDDKVPF